MPPRLRVPDVALAHAWSCGTGGRSVLTARPPGSLSRLQVAHQGGEQPGPREIDGIPGVPARGPACHPPRKGAQALGPAGSVRLGAEGRPEG